MQPCQVCGGVAVDPNGYCTQCRTFRGQVTQPVSGAPYPPQGYQQPTSAAPYPFSGPPISGGGYSAPPAPPTRNRYIGPLIASVAVLVLLVGAIVVLVIVRSGKHDVATGPTGTPTGPVSTAPNAAIDVCLVGTWQAASERQQQDYPSIGPVTMIGKGQVSHIYPDGQVDDDWSQATPYTGSARGHTVTMVGTRPVPSPITPANRTPSIPHPPPHGPAGFSVRRAHGRPAT